MMPLFLGLILYSGLVFATEFEGVKIPPTTICEGKEIPLSGYGIRKYSIFKIRVFVLAVYAPKAIRKGTGMDLEQRPLCFEMTYLRDVDEEDVNKAWEFQFKDSSQHDYPALKEDVMNLTKYFGEIKGERKESFYLSTDSTKIYEDGAFKGEIKGKDFQKSFLSIWFGTNPPTKQLQKQILKD